MLGWWWFRGSLEGAAGSVAVVGTGLDRSYPAAHWQIAAHGALLLSEWTLGTPLALPTSHSAIA